MTNLHRLRFKIGYASTMPAFLIHLSSTFPFNIFNGIYFIEQLCIFLYKIMFILYNYNDINCVFILWWFKY
jgi:hypothetical protein